MQIGIDQHCHLDFRPESAYCVGVGLLHLRQKGAAGCGLMLLVAIILTVQPDSLFEDKAQSEVLLFSRLCLSVRYGGGSPCSYLVVFPLLIMDVCKANGRSTLTWKPERCNTDYSHTTKTTLVGDSWWILLLTTLDLGRREPLLSLASDEMKIAVSAWGGRFREQVPEQCWHRKLAPE
jgi:hypothetical protein